MNDRDYNNFRGKKYFFQLDKKYCSPKGEQNHRYNLYSFLLIWIVLICFHYYVLVIGILSFIALSKIILLQCSRKQNTWEAQWLIRLFFFFSFLPDKQVLNSCLLSSAGSMTLSILPHLSEPHLSNEIIIYTIWGCCEGSMR